MTAKEAAAYWNGTACGQASKRNPHKKKRKATKQADARSGKGS